MPTYQYACKACGEELEAVQTFSEASLTECPNCGGELRKVFSAVGVVFKGSGFYKTDSRSSTTATDAPGDKKSSSSSSESKGESKSDSKGESKSETKTESAPATAPAAKTSTSSSSTPAA